MREVAISRADEGRRLQGARDVGPWCEGYPAVRDWANNDYAGVSHGGALPRGFTSGARPRRRRDDQRASGEQAVFTPSGDVLRRLAPLTRETVSGHRIQLTGAHASARCVQRICAAAV